MSFVRIFFSKTIAKYASIEGCGLPLLGIDHYDPNRIQSKATIQLLYISQALSCHWQDLSQAQAQAREAQKDVREKQADVKRAQDAKMSAQSSLAGLQAQQKGLHAKHELDHSCHPGF